MLVAQSHLQPRHSFLTKCCLSCRNAAKGGIAIARNVDVVVREFGIDPANVSSFCRDRASNNDTGVTNLLFAYENALDQVSFAATLFVCDLHTPVDVVPRLTKPFYNSL